MIRTARDARATSSVARPIAHSPPEFDGTLDAFIERYVLGALPTPESVRDFHEALQTYISSTNPLFLLRYVSRTTRREIYQTGDGTHFRATDNAPAWWVHAALMQGYRIAPDAFAKVAATMPAHMFDVAATSSPTASAAGWHIAHIFGVKDGNTDFERWTRADVVGRFVRNIHPCNYFPIAKTGWQRWGGDRRVIGVFVAMYAKPYRDIWPQFVRFARADDSDLVRVAGPVEYHYSKATAPPRHAGTIPGGLTKAAEQPTPGRLESSSAEYQAIRLIFKRDVIEALDGNDQFRVITPLGTFQMTKTEFYGAFPKVPLTRSYRDAGTYNYPTVPKAAEPFRVS